MSQWNSLPADLRTKIEDRISFRINKFLLRSDCIGDTLLIGDRPAPDAPNDATFHYVPFGATRNSSLYLNLLLENNRIPESSLSWINARNIHGEFTSTELLEKPWANIIPLGGIAEKWVKSSRIGVFKIGDWYHSVPHPSYWKRFHSKEPYPLIDLLTHK